MLLQGVLMAENCIFCKVAQREIPADVLLETARLLAFRDNNPQAPTHVLIIPKHHIPTLEDLGPDDAALIGDLYLAAQQIARQEGIAEDGYRTVINCGQKAGQSVFHIHLHLLGGRSMQWPPG